MAGQREGGGVGMPAPIDLVHIPEQDEIQTLVTIHAILGYRDEGINAYDVDE